MIKNHFINALIAPIKGIINVVMLILLTIFWCIPIYVLFILRLICKNSRWQQWMNYCLIGCAQNWTRTNNLMMELTQNIEWDLPNFDNLQYKQWYFIVSNHQSWSDILILQRIFLKKIPFIRFFIKKELMWVPFINFAWWAFDFPIMHRHSKETLAKYPSLREKDLTATKKACARFKENPVTILNFVEGTRFTLKKHAKQKSPYHNLLIPKAGGFAYAVTAMEKKVTHVLDVTIVYPYGRKTFWDFLCGRVNKITIRLQEREIPNELLQGNYTEDETYRKKFKDWINAIWLEKDLFLNSLLKSDHA